MNKVDLSALGAKLDTPWVPLEVARLEDYHILLALYEGSYPPHYHNKEEFFLVLEGEVNVEIEGAGTVTLRPKDALLIPAGVHHRSSARTPRALVLIVEHREISYNPVVMVAQVTD